METLPQAELAIMQAFWRAEPPLTSRVIMDTVAKDRKWKIQTVSTLLTRLAQRGFLSTQRQGREIHYEILVPRQRYMEVETADFMKKYRGNPLQNLVSAFAETDGLSAEDIDQLSDWLEEQKRRMG